MYGARTSPARAMEPRHVYQGYVFESPAFGTGTSPRITPLDLRTRRYGECCICHLCKCGLMQKRLFLLVKNTCGLLLHP